jgi:hypothetical protein
MVKVGGNGVSSSRQAGTTTVGDAPAARRLGSSRWRDPRLAVGVVLVAASVVLGARVVAAADDTVPIWSLREDVSTGSALTADDVTVAHVHFDRADDADHYFDGDEPLPDDLVAGHDLVSGELLSRSALVDPESRAINELPLPVAEGFYPADLATGDRVEVWVTPEETADEPTAVADKILDEVAVLQTDTASTSVGGGASTVVLVALDADDASELEKLVSAVAQGSVYLAREGE